MVVHACMSVCNGFMIEIYRFMHSLCMFLARAAHAAIVTSQQRTQRIEDNSRVENESRDIENG